MVTNSCFEGSVPSSLPVNLNDWVPSIIPITVLAPPPRLTPPLETNILPWVGFGVVALPSGSKAPPICHDKGYRFMALRLEPV